MRGPHGIGKTALASWVVLWAILTSDDVKVLTTASAWRQLTKFLWPEIHKWATRLRWDKLGREPFRHYELLQRSIKRGPTAEAFALASDNPANIEGAHAARIVYVFDEAKAIADAVFDAAEGAFSTGEAFALAISTPGEPAGRFYDIHRRAPGFEDWYVQHVTLDEAVAAGRVSMDWVEQRKRQWGADSAVYQNRVLGEFATSSETGVIPLAWVEDAMNLYDELADAGNLPAEALRMGCDVGHTGDASVVAVARQAGSTIAITELRQLPRADTMETTGHIKRMLESIPEAYAEVDVIGIGAGVVHRLREQGCNAYGFNAGHGSKRSDVSGELRFLNLRAEAWWNLRDLLSPHSETRIALPRNDSLTGDLTAPHWSMQSNGRIKIESKDDIRKRLGRSTDYGDAVVMALWARKRGVLLG